MITRQNDLFSFRWASPLVSRVDSSTACCFRNDEVGLFAIVRHCEVVYGSSVNSDILGYDYLFLLDWL